VADTDTAPGNSAASTAPNDSATSTAPNDSATSTAPNDSATSTAPNDSATATAPASPFAAEDSRRALYVHGGGADQRALLGSLGDFTLVDAPDQAALVVVSTRMSRAELTATLARLRATLSCPMVALAHTGGESAAVEVMRAGGAGVIAEGNEGALVSYVSGDPYDSSLVETYDRRVGSARSREDSGHGTEDVTSLPGPLAFEERIEELDESGAVPRIAFLHVLNLDGATRKLASEATEILRRRIAVQYRELARVVGAELFALGSSDFAIVGASVSPNRLEQLGRNFIRITESFAPVGNQTLRLALGHAGPEVTTELSTLRELASRALGVAAEQGKSAIVSADSLSLGLASTTELEAAMRVVELIEHGGPLPPGHGLRVARVAAELARHIGFENAERAQIRLAAHLHDIGKVGLPAAAVHADPETLEGELAEAYRSHPERSATFLRPTAGRDVAEAVAAHHEHWDGSGFPHGLAGHEIPVMARIVALADYYDELVHSCNNAGEIAARLHEAAGTRLDPEMVEAALPLLLRVVDPAA
jgi:hypothetical protein